MRAFTSDELSRLQSTQEAAMMDECRLIRTEVREGWTLDEGYSLDDGLFLDDPPTDDHGNPVVLHDTRYQTTACGFDPGAGSEVMDEAEVAISDGTLRLPLDMDDDVQNIDRIQITKRYGVELDPEQQLIFEIVGIPERGPSGLVVKLSQVTDGST